LCFINDTTGFAVSSDCIYKTTNSGYSWDVNYPENRGYRDITFTNADTGFAIGTYQNTLLRTTNGAVISNVLETAVAPSDFALFQNFPNPFNPITTIQYGIARKQHVTLKIYGVLGKEVATLVNAEKPSGNYSVNFDGSRLPSGVYFYRLTAGVFTATKKLILLK
jgi:hypothetical protein